MEDSIRGFRVFRKYESAWKVLGLVVGLATCCAGESNKWTMDELTTSKFPHKVSSDIYRDPRKSDGFVGDIALSRLQHDVYEKELEEEEAREHEKKVAKLHAKSATELDTKDGTRQRRSKREIKSGAFGGVIEKPIGTIVSPSFPNLYPPNKTCIWEIKAAPNHKIFLKFTVFDVQDGIQNCEYDSVNITSKIANDEDINLGVFCGSSLPSAINTEHNYLRIEFRSDESIQKSGFGAFFITDIDECATNNGGCQHICINIIGSYECSCRYGYKLQENLHDCEVPCGGVIEETNGTIFSPLFPNPYPMNTTCIWEITALPMFRIILNFTHFNVQGLGIDKKCEYDRVNITSKVSDDEHKMHGVFCGSRLPPLITSEGNALRIEFSSSNVYWGSGFIAYFFIDINECATNNGGCQQICTNTRGSYICSCRNGYELQENLHDCENVDECARNNGRCQQICNDTIGSYICSCRNGYELQENLHDCEVPCGGVIEETSGTIFSPLFPDPYPKNKICIWEIISPPQYRIILNFTHFNIEPSYQGIDEICEDDSVTITSKVGDDEIRMHGVFCGSGLPPLITSDGNALRIKFSSDDVVQRSGFSAFFFIDIDECATNNGGCQQICNNTIGSYICSCRNGYELHKNLHDCEVSCGGVIEETSGTIFSPLFPDLYPNNIICIWEIISPPQYRIFLKFTHLDVETYYRKDKKCGYDSVIITSKVADDEVRMHGVFCGSSLPPLITSDGNALRIKFSSDDLVQRSGFSAFFFLDPCDSVTDETTVHTVTDVKISGCAKCDLTRLAFHVFLLYLCLWH